MQRSRWACEHECVCARLDLHLPNAADGRRLEVAVDGLALFGGAQLALDTTLVSAWYCDGCARRGAARNEGVASLWLSVTRNRDTLNLLVVEPGLVSWCLPWRLEAGCLPRQSVSSAVRLTPELGKKGGPCIDEPNRPGVCVGVRCWRARRQSCGRQPVRTSRSFRSRRRRSSVARSRAGLCVRGSGVVIRTVRLAPQVERYFSLACPCMSLIFPPNPLCAKKKTCEKSHSLADVSAPSRWVFRPALRKQCQKARQRFGGWCWFNLQEG